MNHSMCVCRMLFIALIYLWHKALCVILLSSPRCRSCPVSCLLLFLPPQPLNPSPASALPPKFGAFEASTAPSRGRAPASQANSKTTAASFPSLSVMLLLKLFSKPLFGAHSFKSFTKRTLFRFPTLHNW